LPGSGKGLLQNLQELAYPNGEYWKTKSWFQNYIYKSHNYTMSPQSPKRKSFFIGEEFQKAEGLKHNIHNDWRQKISEMFAYSKMM
jgi:hypothetical protein